MNGASCGSCRYWADGYCRRRPPQVVQGYEYNRDAGQYEPRPWADTQWPPTDADDWCGEYRPREQAPADGVVDWDALARAAAAAAVQL